MLKQMREGTKSTILKLTLFGLLLLAMTGLALMDVQGMFRRSAGGNTIASFGNDKLTAVDFDRLVQSALRDRSLKQNDAYRAGLPQQILRQEIDNRLLNMEAHDLGLQVDDVLAAKQLKDVLAPLVLKGMSEREALQRLLETYHLSENQLVATLKAQISSQQLINMVMIGARAPRQLVDDALQYRHEWRRGAYFTLTSSIAGALKDPPETELKSYYDSIAREYALPEYRTLSVIVLDKNSLGGDVKISGEKLKQYYDDNLSDYKSAETRVISQTVAADEAAAGEIYAAAEKTKDLQKASAGKGSYIKPQTFAETEMPVELSKTAFAGSAGKVLAPIRSPLGWHVLYIEQVTSAVVRPFAAVKAAIEKDISQDKLSEAMYQRANKIDDEIAGGKTLAEVARENSLHEIVLEKVDARGIGQNGRKPDAAIPLFDKVIDSGFSLKKGTASPLIETPEGSFLIVGATAVFPSEQQPFSRVRAQILARWKSARQTKALADQSARIIERLKKGESFDKLAAEYKQTVRSTALVKRGTPAAKAGMENGLLTAIFSLDRVGHATAVSNDGAVTILRLAERKMQPPAEISKQDAVAMETILNRSLKQDLLEQYRLSLLRKYDVAINDRLLGEMYAPKDENGGGAEE